MFRFFTVLSDGAHHARSQLKKLRYDTQERALQNEEVARESQAIVQPTAHRSIFKNINSQDTYNPAESTGLNKLNKIMRRVFSQASGSRLSFPLGQAPIQKKTQMEATKENLLLHYRVKTNLYKVLQKGSRDSALSGLLLTKRDWREIWLLYVSPLGIYKLNLQNLKKCKEDADIMMSLMTSYNQKDLLNSTIFLQNLIGNPDYFCFFKKTIASRSFSRNAPNREELYERSVQFSAIEPFLKKTNL